jgi:hypothetical protein
MEHLAKASEGARGKTTTSEIAMRKAPTTKKQVE